jgi:zinc protease
LQDHAIDLSFSNSRDHFVGKLKTLKRHSDLAFELLYDSLHTPKFDDEAINRMRASNITRIKSSVAKPQWMGARLMNETYFEGHPYARNSGGTISGLQAITGDDMHAFVKDNFVRDRLVVAVAGNLDMIEASNLVDKIFADLPAKGIERDVPANVTKITNPRKKSFAMPSPQSAVQMVWQTNIDKNHPDYYAYRVMNYILGGGGFSSMLMDEIREKQGLTYGIYSHPVFMNFDNYLAVESATSPENIAPMTASIHAILDDIKTNLVDAEILSDAKSYLIGSLPLRFASTLSLSGAAIRMQLDGRNINALDEWDDKINKVTAADIMRVANQIFDNNDADATVISGAVPDDLEGFDAVTKIDGIE